MRRCGWLAGLVLAGCSPEIAGRAYECGPNQACPSGLVCSAVDSECVVHGDEVPFACPAAETTSEPDDTAAQAHDLGSLDCVSVPAEVFGCVAPGGDQDWVGFQVKGGCPATTAVSVRITYPVGSSPLALALADDGGAIVAMDQPCATSTPGAGNDDRCLLVAVSSSKRYAVRVTAAGHDDCHGACAYNRYQLQVQLTTP
jgi:hypothetical protein